MTPEVCSTCRHYLATPYATRQGQCRARPPHIGVERWPSVNAAEWCGEWRGRLKTPAAESQGTPKA